MHAPVVLFAYKRPDHLRRTLQALERNEGFDQTPVFVCSDGPKAAADEEAVAQVRELIRGCGRPNVELIESRENRGLYRSVVGGVTRLVNEFGRIIVLEDDLVTTPYFLGYMNAALDRYEQQERVLQICGFGVGTDLAGIPETFFTPVASSWGWGTWKRAWNDFTDADPLEGYQRLSASADLRHRFDLDGRYPMYFTLRRSCRGLPDSWAVLWQLFVFLNGGLALWPSASLVENIGSDGQGSHSRWSRRDATAMVAAAARSPVLSFPAEVEVDPEVWSRVVESLVAANPSWHRLVSAWTRWFP